LIPVRINISPLAVKAGVFNNTYQQETDIANKEKKENKREVKKVENAQVLSPFDEDVQH